MTRMKLFSERKGLVKPRLKVQINSMDDLLKGKIWDHLWWSYFQDMSIDHRTQSGYTPLPSYITEKAYLMRLWHHFFHWPADTIDNYHPEAVNKIRKEYASFDWIRVYDFIEFTAHAYLLEQANDEFMKRCNEAFEEELGAYRFVAGWIVDITNEEEIKAVEDAASIPLDPPRQHIQNAIREYSDRKNPYYPNIIKEAISAVESLSQIISGTSQTLGVSIKTTGPKIGLTGQLQESISKMYADCSSRPGVRHGTKEGIEGDADDARFYLIACSAWVNYMYAKAEEKGVLKG